MQHGLPVHFFYGHIARRVDYDEHDAVGQTSELLALLAVSLHPRENMSLVSLRILYAHELRRFTCTRYRTATAATRIACTRGTEDATLSVANIDCYDYGAEGNVGHASPCYKKLIDCHPFILQAATETSLSL